MKKTISFIVFILVALASINASAQTSKLIGTWNSQDFPLQNGKFNLCVKLKENNEGSVKWTTKANGSNYDYNASFTIIVEMPCYWMDDGACIYCYLDKSKATFSVPKNLVKVTSSKPSVQKQINSIKQELIQELEYNSDDLIYDLPEGFTWEIISVSTNKLVLSEDGDVATFTKSTGTSTSKTSKKSSKKR